MNPTDNHVLRLLNVSARYPSASGPALKGCSFALERGEHVALLGVNGSGKTTLLLAIAGLVETEGVITVDGIALNPRSVHEVRNRVGMLFSTPEDQLLFPRVLDDVAYSLLRRGVADGDARIRAQQELELLGVGDLAEKEPYELSHGQRLRVALAGVLVAKPALLLLDEASAALDHPGRRALARLLNETPSAFLLATHDLEVARQSCGRFVVLERGRMIADSRSIDEVRPLIDPVPTL